MTTTRATISALVLLATIAGMAYGQTETLGGPRAVPDSVALEVSLQRTTLEIREPVIAHVRLTNRGDKPFRLYIRDGGAPLRLAFQVARLNASYDNHSLWLQRSGPGASQVELGPGESTSGDILVLLDYGKGYVFASPGGYSVRCRWFGKVYSDEIRVTVVNPSRVNDQFLDELELVALRHDSGEAADTLDLNTPEAKKGMDRLGILLLGKIVSQQKPHLVDPQRNPADKREAKLVEALTDLLDRQPDSSYSGYVARFLGLVHIKTFEHVASHGHLERWTQENLTEELQVVYDRAARAREKALRYLTMAAGHDLWPRTTAYFELAHLYGLSEQWDKVSAVCDKLRTDYAEQDGAALADKLESEMRKYREKIARRKEAD